jgi:hypothetical protein
MDFKLTPSSRDEVYYASHKTRCEWATVEDPTNITFFIGPPKNGHFFKILTMHTARRTGS